MKIGCCLPDIFENNTTVPSVARPRLNLRLVFLIHKPLGRHYYPLQTMGATVPVQYSRARDTLKAETHKWTVSQARGERRLLQPPFRTCSYAEEGATTPSKDGIHTIPTVNGFGLGPINSNAGLLGYHVLAQAYTYTSIAPMCCKALPCRIALPCYYHMGDGQMCEPCMSSCTLDQHRFSAFNPSSRILRWQCRFLSCCVQSLDDAGRQSKVTTKLHGKIRF